MREKKLRLVVTFHTTAAAMAFEKKCKAAALDGKLAPIPRTLSSDCGIAWICDTAEKERILQLCENTDVNQIEEVLL